MNVLVTSAGAAPGYSLINGLSCEKGLDINVIATDRDKYAPGLYMADKYFILPEINSPSYLTEILKLCKTEKIDAVFPILEEELPLFANNKEKFDKLNLKVFVNNNELLATCFDKELLAKFCMDNSILIPITYNLKNIIERIDDISFPVLCKKKAGRREKDPMFIKNKNDLLSFVETNVDKNIFFQEFISGDEYTVEMILTSDGAILQCIPRKRIATKAGVCTKALFIKDREIINLSEDIAKKLMAVSPLNLQFIRNCNDLFLIDVNPKFPGGGGLTITNGVNVPVLLLKKAFNMPIDNSEFYFDDNSVVIRYWENIKVV